MSPQRSVETTSTPGVPAARSPEDEITLLELLDRVLDKGVVLSGEVTLSVADVDLVYLGLRVLLSSVEAADRMRGRAEQPDGTEASSSGDN